MAWAPTRPPSAARLAERRPIGAAEHHILEAHAARGLGQEHPPQLLALAIAVDRDVGQRPQVGDGLPAREEQLDRAPGLLGDVLARWGHRDGAAGCQPEREEGEKATA